MHIDIDEKSPETAIYRVFQGNRMIRKIFIRAAFIAATIRVNRMRSGHHSVILYIMLLRKSRFEHFHHHKHMLYFSLVQLPTLNTIAAHLHATYPPNFLCIRWHSEVSLLLANVDLNL